MVIYSVTDKNNQNYWTKIKFNAFKQLFTIKEIKSH